jgi:cysteine-S-conjugate beta-lyase
VAAEDGITNLSLDDLRRRRSAKWSWYDDDVLPAWVAEMDFPLAPAIKEALALAVERDDAGYASPDAAGLGRAFAGFAQRRLGWEVDAERVAPLNDVVSGLFEFVRVLTQPGDGIVINPPVYHPFFAVIEQTGRTVVEAPLRDGRELDLDAIEAAFAGGARVLILCNPHNPTGAVLARDELERIAEIAAEHDAWVLADEIHSPLVLPGARHVAFTTVSKAAAERGIVLTSASKAFNIAGLKCAVAVTASEAAAAKVAELPEIAKHCGHFGVLASVAAFESADEWLDEVIGVLDANRQLLAELLAEHLPQVGYTLPAAGYLAWLDCRALGLGDDPAEALLGRGRVALTSGPQFGTGGDGFARLNYATSPELLAEAVKRMAEGAEL